MKVLALTHSYKGNGAARCLLDLVQHGIAQWGWQVTAFGPNDPAERQAIAQTGATPIADVQHLHYDLAIVNSVVSLEGFAQVLERLPTLLWVHEGATPLQVSPHPLATWQRWLGQAKAVVLQSNWQRDVVWKEALATTLPERVHVLANALSPTTQAVVAQLVAQRQAEQAGKATSTLRSIRFGALPEGSSDQPRLQAAQRGLLWCGSVIGRKRPQDFLQAVLGLQQSGLQLPPVQVVGGLAAIHSVPHPNFQAGAAALKAAHPHVEFVGELAHAQTLQCLKRAGVFVSTSEEETQGLALLEAAALQLPLVVSDLPPYRGIWQHGHNCLMYPAGDVAGLQAHLQTLLQAPTLAQRLGQAAAATAAQFDWNGFASRMHAVVASVRA